MRPKLSDESKTVRVSFTISKKDWSEFKAAFRRLKLRNKSDAIREFIRAGLYAADTPAVVIELPVAVKEVRK